MTSLLLEAEAVSKSFDGVPALRHGALTLKRGSVHALCGGNGAGKSTFLNILTGLLPRDAGTIRVRDQEVHFASPVDALASRIAIITQELAPVPEMTVAENLFLGREPRRAGVIVNHRQMEIDAQRILDEVGFDLDASRGMADLSLAQAQLVEITRAISRDAEIVIMDEPTSAIGEHESHILFDAIRRLQAKGVGIIYVSHRLEELFEIADTYTVFRDGAMIATGPMTELNLEGLVALIVGHELHSHTHAERKSEAGNILEVSDLVAHRKVRGVSLNVATGEVVGLYGLIGGGPHRISGSGLRDRPAPRWARQRRRTGTADRAARCFDQEPRRYGDGRSQDVRCRAACVNPEQHLYVGPRASKPLWHPAQQGRA
jgi:putative xylitol transport system ATP-binding protein